MRPNYPVTNQELLNDFREIQEHLIKLLGYDANIFDGTADVSGVYDSLEDTLYYSGIAYLDQQCFSTIPLYGDLYRLNLIHNFRSLYEQ